MRPRQDTYFFMKAGLSFLLLVSILFPTSAGMANTAKPADEPIILNFPRLGKISEKVKITSIRNILSAQKQLIIDGSIELENCKTNPQKTQETCTVSYVLNKRSVAVANTGGGIKNMGETLKTAGYVCAFVAVPGTGADGKVPFLVPWWKNILNNLKVPLQYLRNKCDDLIKNTAKKTIEIAGLTFAVVRERAPKSVTNAGRKTLERFVIVGKSIGENMGQLINGGKKNVIGWVSRFLVAAGRFIPWVGKMGNFLLELKFKIDGILINSVTGGEGNWFGVFVDNAGKFVGEMIVYYVGTTILQQGTEFIGNGLVDLGKTMSAAPTEKIKRPVIIRY